MRIIIRRDEAATSIAIFFAIVLIIRPQYFISAFPSSVFLFTIFQTATVVAMSIKIKRIMVDRFICCLLLYYIYDNVNTFIKNPSQINGAVVAGVWAISAVYIMAYYAKKIGIPKTLKKISVSVTILLWMNLLLYMIFPEGMINIIRGTGRPISIHFLGEANRLTSYYMLSIVLVICSIFVAQEVNKLYLTISVLVIPISYFVIEDKSSTALVGGFILIIGLIVNRFFPKVLRRIILNPVSSICIILFAFIGITRILTLDIVANFIINVLNKDITLSERTTIWSAAYAALSDFNIFIFGLGERAAGGYITIWTGHTFSAHNLFLQIMLLGGIILLSIFMVMVIDTVRNTSKISNSKQKAILSICLLAFFFINMMEVYVFAIVVLTK